MTFYKGQPLGREHLPKIELEDIPLKTDQANVARILLRDRYPEDGFAINTTSAMIVLVLEGSVTLCLDEEETSWNNGDTVLVPTNKPYCWVPETQHALLYIVSTPPWTLEQQRIIHEPSDSVDQP